MILILIYSTYLKQYSIDYLSENITITPIPPAQPPGINIQDLKNKRIWYSNFVIIDKDNNIVCITTTVESSLGFVILPGWFIAIMD